MDREWFLDAGEVLGRGLLAGALVGGALGAALGTVFGLPFGTVVGVVVGAVAGLLPALVAAPVLAVVHARVDTDLGTRRSAALAAVLGTEAWAVATDQDLATCVVWGLAGAVVGLSLGPWVVRGPKPPRESPTGRR